MNIPSNYKDVFYNLLKEPTKEKFREFMRTSVSEEDLVEFKEDWIEDASIAKEILSIANTGEGMIIFGVKENDDNSYDPVGITDVLDKTKLHNKVKKYIPQDLKYESFIINYDCSEYNALADKKFQVIIIENQPKLLPFFSLREGGDKGNKILENTVYVRRGGACERANKGDIERIIKKRISYENPSTGQEKTIKQHFEELEILYSLIPKVLYKREGGLNFHGMISALEKLAKYTESVSGKVEEEVNPDYPEESYIQFVQKMIDMKKKKIAKVLNV